MKKNGLDEKTKAQGRIPEFGYTYGENGPFEIQIYDKNGNVHAKYRLTKESEKGLYEALWRHLGLNKEA